VRIDWENTGKNQKRKLIHKVTEVVLNILKVPKSNCMVLLKEILMKIGVLGEKP
jgi:phenylpyruvate tautomerase PptA (4-oxalocrotonate tautomerase family)